MQFSSWPHGGAEDPPSLSGSGRGKSGGAVGEGVGAGVGGSVVELRSPSSDAPCAGCGEQQAADGAPNTTSVRSRSCCRTLAEDFPGVTRTLLPRYRQHVPGAAAAAGSGSGSGRAGLRGQHGGTVR